MARYFVNYDSGYYDVRDSEKSNAVVTSFSGPGSYKQAKAHAEDLNGNPESKDR